MDKLEPITMTEQEKAFADFLGKMERAIREPEPEYDFLGIGKEIVHQAIMNDPTLYRIVSAGKAANVPWEKITEAAAVLLSQEKAYLRDEILKLHQNMPSSHILPKI